MLFRRRGWLPLFILLTVPLAFVHYTYPFNRHEVQEAWTFVCMGLALVGQLIRFVTIAYVPARTSGRNRRTQVAELLNTDGTYSMVRNPLYLGNCLSWLGLAAIPHSPWLWLCIALVFWIYHERVILAEESFLEERFGDEFRSWAARTPVFLPNPMLWRKPMLAPSFRTAIAREHVNWFVLATAFAVLDTIADSVAEAHFHIDPGWAISWSIALVLFLLVRYLKKCTAILTVPDRAW